MAELTSGVRPTVHARTGLLAHVTVWKVILYVLLIFFSLSFLMPFLWMISTALKNTEQTYQVPPIWIPWPLQWVNFPDSLRAQPFDKFFENTAFYAVLACLGAVLSTSLVAYGFSRIRWVGRDALFFVCISTLMIPFQVKMIPLFLIFRDLHWLNTYAPLIVPTYFGDAYLIFLLRQFFMSIPQELSEAAKIDGASELAIFFRIVLPLARPAIAVVALFQFMFAWSDYQGPLIYLNQPETFPISLGLQRFMGQFVEKLSWPYLMAASTVTVLPILILFFIAQRTFIEGISVSGIKG